MFNFKKPTAQMLWRLQPWHKGHSELFKKSLAESGQVCIMIRDVQNIDAGMGNDDNPFHYDQVVENIKQELSKEGFTYYEEYVIIIVPNIVNISYGRGVGYTFTEHDLGKEIHSISATKIRKKLRDEGKLWKQ